MVGRNEPCPCGSGKKYKKCCIDTNDNSQISTLPDTRAQRAWEVYIEIDKICEMYRNQNPNHPCAVGCTECCSQPILVHPEEFSLIQVGINELDDTTLNIISNKTSSYFEHIDNRIPNFIHLLNYLTKTTNWRENVTHIIDELEQINLPCPFLLDNKCVIYDCRPLICRMYGFIHLFDEKSGKVYWISKCSKLNDPQKFGVQLPGSLVSIEARVKLRSTPLPLIGWLIKNARDPEETDKLLFDMCNKPLTTPKFNHKKLEREISKFYKK